MQKIAAVFRLPTTKNILINASGNYLNVVFTVIYTLVLVRTFDRASYGVFSVLVALAAVLANVLDFGVTASIFSELPVLYKTRDKALAFLKTNVIFQTVLAAIALFFMYVFVDVFDAHILKLSIPHTTYLMTFLTVPLLIWQNSILNALYATNNFFTANLYINTANVAKIIALFWFVFAKSVTVETTLFSLFIIGPTAFLTLVLMSKRHLVGTFLESNIQRHNIKLRYSLTYFLSTQLFNLASRVDLFMLSFYLPNAQVGLYAPAQKIVLTVITAVNSITQVLSPQFAKAHTKKQVRSIVKRGVIYMILPTAVFIAVILTPFEIYRLFFTDRFAQTADIARALSFSYIFFSMSAVPLLFFLYTIRKASYLLWINGLLLGLTSIGCFVLIPQLGLFGPPIAFGAAYVSVLVVSSILFWFEYRKFDM